MNRLTRLADMSREELAWRVRARSRIEAQRLHWWVRRPGWDRSAITRALAPGALTPPLRRAATRGDWAAVGQALHDQLRARPSRFVLDPARASELAGEITRRWPQAREDAAGRADRILEGTYDLLGHRGLRCDDWHRDVVRGRRMPDGFWAAVPYLDPRHGDHKVVWELNRHQHWLALGRACWLTGDSRYSEAIGTQLDSWLRANPPLTGANWASMLELALRSLSWLWAIHVPLAGTTARGAELVDMFVGLDRQLSHVASNLSHYFSPNTHLTGEALALYVAGSALPELRQGGQWVETGRRVLLAEIARQVAPDGGHAERSTHYHRYTLDFYLLALAVAEATGDRAAIAPFREVCARLAAFARELADDAGRLPNIGDDDGGSLWPIAGRSVRDVRDSLAVAAALLGDPSLGSGYVPEECWWIAGIDRTRALVAAAAPAAAPDFRATCFRHTGYAVVRSGRDHLVFDAGPHGYLNGGHAHADALSVTLAVDGQPLLIDPGTGTYTMDAGLRDRLRSSRCHNTLTLDGRSSSVPDGPFHWRTRADAHLGVWRGNPGFAWAVASHDGYAPAEHRRTIVTQRGAGWLFVDEVLGSGHHRADVHWHLDPAWRASADDGHRLRLDSRGAVAWLLHEGGEVAVMSADPVSGLGWCSPVYGAVVPATTVRTTSEAPAPFARATWVGTGAEPPTMERVPVRCEGAGALGWRVTQGASRWTTILAPGDAGLRDARGVATADYHADAGLVQYGVRDGGALIALALADASHLLSLQDGLISIAAEAMLPDLHVAIEREIVTIVAASPPPFLRLEGTPLASVRAIRLNGRDHPIVTRAATGRRDVIELVSTDWAPCVESPALSI